MSELEQRLRDYGAHVAYPDADVTAVVVARLERRRWHARRPLVLLAAAVAVAVTAAMAVPAARSALLELLGLEGAKIVRIDELPNLPSSPRIDLGAQVTLAEAQRQAPFPILVPDEPPDHVFVAVDASPGAATEATQVTLIYGRRAHPRLFLSEFRPCCDEDVLTKEVPTGVKVEPVTVSGGRGYWIGGRHVLGTGDTRRIVGSTLLWERAGITLRLEADLTRDQALELAESLAPYGFGD